MIVWKLPRVERSPGPKTRLFVLSRELIGFRDLSGVNMYTYVINISGSS